jgi:hypothetical protein
MDGRNRGNGIEDAAMGNSNLWNYRAEIAWTAEHDLTGFDVDALDGHIGTVDAMSYEADDAHIVVDTGFWIFGKRRLIPAGAITAVDVEQRRITIGLTKDQVHHAPDFEPEHEHDPIHRSNYDEYYGPHGW